MRNIQIEWDALSYFVQHGKKTTWEHQIEELPRFLVIHPLKLKWFEKYIACQILISGAGCGGGVLGTQHKTTPMPSPTPNLSATLLQGSVINSCKRHFCINTMAN